MLELWGMQSTSSLPGLPGPLQLEVVALDKVLCMDLIELFETNLNLVQKENMINWIFEIELLDHLTVHNQMTDI